MELKASELRENNKLLFMGKVVTFDYIAKKRVDGIFWIKVKEPNLDHKNFHFKPIELSEEILLKCGFKIGFDTYLPFQKSYSLGEIILSEEFILSGESGVMWQIGKPFLFLHQLQNAIFAITQTELEINL